MCTHSCLPYSFFLVLFGDTPLLLSSRRRGGVHPELPGVRGLLGVRLPVDVPVAPSFREFSYMYLRFRCIRHFVIHVINNIRTRFIISFYVICAVIYCSFCCIYMWLDPGTYMIARFISFYKPGVTWCHSIHNTFESLVSTWRVLPNLFLWELLDSSWILELGWVNPILESHLSKRDWALAFEHLRSRRPTRLKHFLLLERWLLDG